MGLDVSTDDVDAPDIRGEDELEWWIFLLIAISILLCLIIIVGSIVWFVSRKREKRRSTAPPREMFRQTSASAHLESSTGEFSSPAMSSVVPSTNGDRVAIYSSMPEMPPSGQTLANVRSEYADAESIRQLGTGQSAQYAPASINYGMFGDGGQPQVQYDRAFVGPGPH
jgi:hypothetical protein